MATKKTVKKAPKKAPKKSPAKKTVKTAPKTAPKTTKAKRGGGRPRKDQFGALQDYRVAAIDLENVKETFPFGSLWTSKSNGTRVRTVVEVRNVFVEDDQVVVLCHEGGGSLLVQAGWLQHNLVRLTALENAEVAGALNGSLFESPEAESSYRATHIALLVTPENHEAPEAPAVDTNAAYAYVAPEDREAYGRDKGIPPYKEAV